MNLPNTKQHNFRIGCVTLIQILLLSVENCSVLISIRFGYCNVRSAVMFWQGIVISMNEFIHIRQYGLKFPIENQMSICVDNFVDY
jgi:hypothetical protein